MDNDKHKWPAPWGASSVFGLRGVTGLFVGVFAVLLAPSGGRAGSPFAHVTATTYRSATQLRQTAGGWRAVHQRRIASQQFTSGTVVGRCENGDGLILTCAHGKPKGAELTIEFRDQPSLAAKGRVVALDEQHDLCLVRSSVGKADVVEVAVKRPQRGDPIRLIGWGHQKYNDRSGELASVANGFLFSDVDSLVGDSGGAVLNADGDLCGVIKATTAKDQNKPARRGNENDSISIAAPVILDFLNASDDWKARRREEPGK